MRSSLYGPWYCIAQRPHHLAGVLLRAGWRVEVFTHRSISDVAPTLSVSPGIRSRTSLPGRIGRLPLARRLAGWHQRRIEQKTFSEFTSSGADLLVHYRRPAERSAAVAALPGAFVYDCVDDWEGFGGTAGIETHRWERLLCDRADHIWVVSRHLQEKLSAWRHKVSYAPNGVDYPHFAGARRPAEDRLPVDRPRRLIYIGALQRWFDARLAGEVAARLPDWRIDLVGPCQLDASQRARLGAGNVRFLGRRDYSQLPALLATADVAMIPFVIDDLIKGTSPIKLYEYLAAGVPVVASPMPEVLPYVERGVVACAAEPAEFARLVEELAHSPNPDRCQEVARASSWDARFLPLLGGIAQRRR